MKSTNSLPRTLNDHQLYSLLKKGDPHSLAPIYARYQRLLFWHGKQMLEDDFVVETLVQDVFLKLWDKQIFILPEDELKRVLYTSVRNACIDSLRRINLEQEIIDNRMIQLKLDELDFFEASDELFMTQDILNILLEKIDELPEKSRIIFRLSYIEGLKASEIAEQMDLSVRTVENQLYRSLQQLRKKCSNLFVYLFII